MLEQADFRLERTDLKPERARLKREEADSIVGQKRQISYLSWLILGLGGLIINRSWHSKSERTDFGLQRVELVTQKRVYRCMKIHAFYRTSALWGRCPSRKQIRLVSQPGPHDPLIF